MVFAGRDEREEAAFVVRTIRRLLSQGEDPREIAVLFRSGFHSYKLELELSSAGLVYEKRGGLKLTESAHMKDMIAFLRLQTNPHDGLSWNRILLHLEKVGPTTAQKIAAAVAGAAEPMAALRDYPAGSGWQEGYTRLVGLFTALQHAEAPPAALCMKIREYYQPVFERLYHDDFPKREKDLDQLQAIIAGYDRLQDFIDDTSLDPPEDAPAGEAALDRLVLSTIHSAKGLEFTTVFVIGLADGRFPHAAATFGESWEEERRLLYVAATRARVNLYLTYPRQLMTPDRQFRRVGMSSFLGEIQPGLYTRVAESGLDEEGPYRVTTPTASPASATPRHKRQELKNFSVGCRVKHHFFGNGVVTRLNGGRSLDVHFDRHGMRTLHLDYARLTTL
jgi:DNA helicase-2/ATP-dependent DNA helicase PcrA